ILLLFVGIYGLQAQCQHSVELVDSYNDGWGDGKLTIKVNDVAVLTDITLGYGESPKVSPFEAKTGDVIDAYYTAPSSWPTENEFTVKGVDGTILGQSGQGGDTPGNILAMSGYCPTCFTPSLQTVSNITQTSAILAWTSGGAEVWDIEYGLSGFIPGEGTIITVTEKPYTLTGLSVLETYDWYVRDICSADDKSVWLGPSSFSTQMIPISSFPYTENFDGTWSGTPAAPDGWKVVNFTGSWYQEDDRLMPPHSGGYSAVGSGYSVGNYLITPLLDLTGVDVRIRWWDRVRVMGRSNSYKILVSTTTTNITAFTEDLGTYVCTETEWTEHLLDLSAYNGQNIYVAFYHFKTQAPKYLFGIDDVRVEEISTIPNPATVSFPTDNLVTLNNPILSWARPLIGEPVTGYKVYLSTSTTPSNTTALYDGPNTSFQTSGLTTGTQYYWQVVPYNEHGDAANTEVWSFTIAADGYLAESFEGNTFPPAVWVNPGGWSRNTSDPFAGSASAYKRTY
ncbi:MAG: choice-of-anchor J domain-containing protein, partial [Taibaiella sp.]|nr:choice-of-anchor J domain-containing protein [Taibaiella sp.]